MPAARALHRKGIFYPDQIAHEDGRGPNGVHFRDTRGVSRSDIETIYSYFHRTPRAEILQQKKDRSLPLGLSEEQLTRLRNTFRSQRRISGGEHILVYTDGGYDPDTMRGSYGVAFISHNHIEAGRVPFADSSYRTEWYAIGRAMQLIHPRYNGLVTIRTDSMSATTAWNAWLSEPDEIRRKRRDRDIIRMVEKEVTKRGCTLHLEHVRGHAGVAGNELADRLATIGLEKPDWFTPFYWTDTMSWPDGYAIAHEGHLTTMPIPELLRRAEQRKQMTICRARPRDMSHNRIGLSKEDNRFLRNPTIHDNVLRVNILGRCNTLPTSELKSSIYGIGPPRCNHCGHHTDDQIHALLTCSAGQQGNAEVDDTIRSIVRRALPRWETISPAIRLSSPVTGRRIGPRDATNGPIPTPQNAHDALLGLLPKSFRRQIRTLVSSCGVKRTARDRKALAISRAIQRKTAAVTTRTWNRHCRNTHQ